MIGRLLRVLLGWAVLLAVATECGNRLLGRTEADRDRNPPGPGPRLLRLLLAWILLLALLAIEFGVSFLAIGRPMRPLILAPAVLMVVTVGSMFMQVDRGPTIVRLFAMAALLWLTILLGLGSLDPLTRTDYHVQAATIKR